MVVININTYVCVLSTDNYLDGALILNENLKCLQSKYPLLCLVNEKISEYTKSVLTYFGINYKIIKMIEYDSFSEENDYWKYTFDKLNIFSLIEYKKIVYLDLDLLLLKNVDHLFNEKHLTMAQDAPFYNGHNSGIMILEPNIDDYNKMIEYASKCNNDGKKYSDQNIINECFDNIFSLPIEYNKMVGINSQLNRYYDFIDDNYILTNCVKDYSQFNNNPFIVHYIGKLKPFMVKCNYYDEYVNLYRYYYLIVCKKKDYYNIISKSGDLITIIVPIYNNQKSIERCLESIVNQTYSNLEIILINDGSTDNSLAICDKYSQMDDRIIIINNKFNMGVSYSRNMGLKRASGKYVGFVDVDDYIEKNMYEIMYYNCIKFGAECCQCGVYLDNNLYRSSCTDNFHMLDNEDILFNMICNWYISTVVWDKLFTRELLNNIFFDEEIHKHEDAKFVTAFFENCNNAVFIKDVLYHYNDDCGHSLYNHKELNENLELIKINQEIENRVNNILPDYKAVFYNNKYYTDIRYILNQIIENQFSDKKEDVLLFINFVKNFFKEHNYIDDDKVTEINSLIMQIEQRI